MSPLEHARTAFEEILAHKVRSALTCLSLAIGVAALLFTFSQTSGTIRDYQRAKVLAGPGRLQISYRDGYVSKGISPGFTSDDADAIRAAWPGLYMVYPHVERHDVHVRVDDFSSDQFTAAGINEQWRKRDWVYKLSGRFFSAEDVARAARVCVFIQPGGWYKRPYWARFFPDSPLTTFLQRHDLVGHEALIEGHVFTVVGELREPPKDLDPRWFREWGADGLILVPVTTYQDYLAQSGRNPKAVDDIEVDTGDEATAPYFRRRIEAFLAARHREPDVRVRDFREIMEGALKEIRQFVLSILIIGIVAVLASGIGIMNVTVATIFSRVREIGIRRALGARRIDILAQFVVEAMALGLVGGVAGTALGVVGVVYLAPDAHQMGSIGPLTIAASLLVALATGFFFALYPAYQASRLDPVESLRYE